MTEQIYPGPEGFWRTSPELIGMQEDLEKLWNNLEGLSALEDGQILDLRENDLIAVKRYGTPSTYKIFELGYTPNEVERFPRKPFLVRPEEGHNEQDAPLMVHLSQWPSGFDITATHVTNDYDNNIFVQRREDEIKRISTNLSIEATRQSALKMMKHQHVDTEEGKRILDIVKNVTDEI